jgi:hypothetical protein
LPTLATQGARFAVIAVLIRQIRTRRPPCTRERTPSSDQKEVGECYVSSTCSSEPNSQRSNETGRAENVARAPRQGTVNDTDFSYLWRVLSPASPNEQNEDEDQGTSNHYYFRSQQLISLSITQQYGTGGGKLPATKFESAVAEFPRSLPAAAICFAWNPRLAP